MEYTVRRWEGALKTHRINNYKDCISIQICLQPYSTHESERLQATDVFRYPDGMD